MDINLQVFATVHEVAAEEYGRLPLNAFLNKSVNVLSQKQFHFKHMGANAD